MPTEVVQHYWRTLEHLEDARRGHISERHPYVEENDRPRLKQNFATLKREGMAADHLVYCEWDSHANRIVSIGHHFRYRWRYADTVRTRWTKAGPTERDLLRPVSGELEAGAAVPPETKHQPPTRLTGARLLMGYTGDNPGSKGIGTGDFQHLAGRLAFNMALEHTDRPEGDTRFVRGERGAVVPLKILGMPRPSAVEHYIDQSERDARDDGGTMVTYGDLANVDPGGNLNGRKFYLHQPTAATEEGYKCFETNDPAVVASDQAALARFVSPPGSVFRFTLRFRDLRPWELGAVLVALDPTKIEHVLRPDPNGNLTARYLMDLGKHLDGEEPAFALKLGHGRPLGMGSVRVGVKAARLMKRDGSLVDEPTTEETALRAFWKKATRDGAWESAVLLPWLKVQQYRGRERAEYPATNGEIYTHHTNLRRKHAEGRRQEAPQAGVERADKGLRRL